MFFIHWWSTLYFGYWVSFIWGLGLKKNISTFQDVTRISNTHPFPLFPCFLLFLFLYLFSMYMSLWFFCLSASKQSKLLFYPSFFLAPPPLRPPLGFFLIVHVKKTQVCQEAHFLLFSPSNVPILLIHHLSLVILYVSSFPGTCSSPITRMSPS